MERAAPAAVEATERADPAERMDRPNTAPGNRGWRWSVAVVGLVALGLRWWSPGEPLRTADSYNWMRRSIAFGEAIRSWDLAAATTDPTGVPATRPGVTTMWTGFLAEELVAPARHVATTLGWDAGPSHLRLAQVLMALWCVLGIVVFTLVARRLVGARAAVIAGGLLAVEPFFVGHSSVLHTDALLAIGSAVSVMALAACVRAHHERPLVAWSGWWRTDVGRLALLGGVAGGVAGLTKVNAGLLVGVGLLAAFVPLSRRRVGQVPAVIAVASALAVVVAMWPALWVDPWGQVRACIDSLTLAGEGTGPAFFMGEVTSRDRGFYPVAAWYRASAWLLVGALLALGWWCVAGFRRRRASPGSRRALVVLVLPPLAYAVALGLSDKHYDRYLLPLLPFVALGVGVCASRALDGIGAGRAVGRLGWAGLGLAAGWTASLAPFAISHVDPLVGGQRAALKRLSLGWGEGSETVLARVDSHGRCPTISSRQWFLYQPGCWTPTDFDWLDGSEAPPQYVLVNVQARQAGATRAEDKVLRAHGTLLEEVVIDGVTYAELWRPGRPERS